jgi:hypothetical protein
MVRQEPDQRTAIMAQSCTIMKRTLCIETNVHGAKIKCLVFGVWGLWLGCTIMFGITFI